MVVWWRGCCGCCAWPLWLPRLRLWADGAAVWSQLCGCPWGNHKGSGEGALVVLGVMVRTFVVV